MDIITIAILAIAGLVVLILALSSIKIVRPTHRAYVERLGRFRRLFPEDAKTKGGITLIIPFIDAIYSVNTTERVTDIQKQEVITGDNLNCSVDAQVYYKVNSDDESIKRSQYAVNDFEYQIVALARTTLRNVIGNMPLKEVNSERNKINQELRTTLELEADKWGIAIVRTELKDILPPQEVQEVMNKVVVAENTKIAAVNFATSVETEADGQRRAAIKQADGEKQALVLTATGRAEAVKIEADAKAYQIKLVNESAEKYFVGNAQVLRKLEAVETTMKDSSKIVLPQNQQLVNVIDSLAGLVPLPVKKK